MTGGGGGGQVQVVGQIQQQPQLVQPGMGVANVVSAPPPGTGTTQQMATNLNGSCNYGADQLVRL